MSETTCDPADASFDGRYGVFVDGELVEDGLRTDVELEAVLDTIEDDSVEIRENPHYEPPSCFLELVGITREEVSERAVAQLQEYQNETGDPDARLCRTALFGAEEIAVTSDASGGPVNYVLRDLVGKAWDDLQARAESPPSAAEFAADLRTLAAEFEEDADAARAPR